MFFSAKDLYTHFLNGNSSYSWREINSEMLDTDRWGTMPAVTMSRVKRILKEAKRRIVIRNVDDSCVYKFLRPWDVVPALKEWKAPAGKWGVGIEVETSFRSGFHTTNVAKRLQHWKHIAIDGESGVPNGLEVTFPPVVHDKFKGSQAERYLKLLHTEFAGDVNQPARAHVGIHVNVSAGEGGGEASGPRTQLVVDALYRLSDEDKLLFFGRRRPYGYIYDQGTHLEYKMFQSTTDVKALRKYVNVAVSLSELIHDTSTTINHNKVVEVMTAALAK